MQLEQPKEALQCDANLESVQYNCKLWQLHQLSVCLIARLSVTQSQS